MMEGSKQGTFQEVRPALSSERIHLNVILYLNLVGYVPFFVKACSIIIKPICPTVIPLSNLKSGTSASRVLSNHRTEIGYILFSYQAAPLIGYCCIPFLI